MSVSTTEGNYLSKTDRIRAVVRRPDSEKLTADQIIDLAGVKVTRSVVSHIRGDLGRLRYPNRTPKAEQRVGSYHTAIKNDPKLDEWLRENCPADTTLTQYLIALARDVMNDELS